jgi:hypothetical protein
VARQISRRTTDLLAIAIVAVGGLTVGGRLSQWWSTEPEEVTSASRSAGSVSGSASPWGSGGAAVSFDLGDRPHLLRKQSVTGDRRQAAAALVDVCRHVVAGASAPQRKIDANERRLLTEVEQRAAAEEQKGTWKIYRLDEPLPLVVGTRHFSTEAAGDGRKSSAADAWRVVCWGMAFPSEDRRWRLFAFHTPGERTSPQSVDVELPAGSRRIMSLRADSGEALVGFEGDGPPEAWIGFFDGWFRENGWRLSGRWESSGGGWTARYSPADDDRSSRVDVHFTQTGDAKWSGLLDVIPLSTEAESGKP